MSGPREAEMLRRIEDAETALALLRRLVMESMMETSDECVCRRRDNVSPRFPEPAPFTDPNSGTIVPNPGTICWDGDDPPSRDA